MGQNPYRVVITVENAARGSVEAQEYLQFEAAECVCSWSWGLQPATALIDWVSASAQAPILALSQLTIQFIERASNTVLHTFYGLCKSVTPKVSSDGRSTFQEFVDSREFLQYDLVYCAFNKRESKIVNGRWVRRYWHIYPADFNRHLKTYTPGPLTAREIMDELFASPTCESPWVRAYIPALDFPVWDFDCLSGKKLGTALTELSEALGCVFTLSGGRYRLAWTMKGTAPAPDFPTNSDNRRKGEALSGNPTRVRLLGGGNLYQVMNLALEPDWLPAWQKFYDLDWLADDLFASEKTEAAIGDIPAGTPYNDIPLDVAGLQGHYLAAARARTITVGQYAALRDTRDGTGESYRDYRKFGGRTRLAMPAALYIADVVFRAFRPPNNFQLRNDQGVLMNVFSLDLVDHALVEVTHDPITGLMEWELDVISASNGYAIVKGYQVAQDQYKTLRPEHFKAADWINNQALWQHLTFQIDDSGEGTKFIVFDAPVIASGDLIKEIAIDGVTQKYPALNAIATVHPPLVRASLVFQGEPFSYIDGFGTKDDVVNMPGLNGEFVAELDPSFGGAPVMRVTVELPYADGLTATQKAAGNATSLLNRQFAYELGGYLVQAINGTQLSPSIDRVTVRWGVNGATEEVDFTTERSRNVAALGGRYILSLTPERDFDRREQLLQLLPGQRELKEEARLYRLNAAAVRQNPRWARTLVEAFVTAFGFDAMPARVFIDPAYEPSGPLAAGTPIFKDKADGSVLSPQGEVGDVTAIQPVFLGATVFDGEKADGSVRVSVHGDDGIVYARVMGPVSVGESVGLGESAMSYLEGSPSLSVGVVQEDVEDGVIAVVPVRTAGGGGGDGAVWV